MLNKKICLAIVICVCGPSAFAEPIKFIDSPTIYFADTTNLQVNQDAQITFESFLRNWSQFEILVNKIHFPIAAPNCKETIQIRFKGIEPSKNLISETQQARWELLERIRNGDHQNRSPIFLKIDTKKYMSKSTDGKYSLNYCNVFID